MAGVVKEKGCEAAGFTAATGGGGLENAGGADCDDGGGGSDGSDAVPGLLPSAGVSLGQESGGAAGLVLTQ